MARSGAWGKGRSRKRSDILSSCPAQPAQDKEPGLFSVPPGSSEVQHISGDAQGGGGEYPLSSMCSCIVMYDVRPDII